MPPRQAPSSHRAAPRRGGHAATRGTGVRIDSWNLPLRHPEGGFLGDRASQTAFRELLDQARRAHSTCARDPFGRTPTAELDKREIDMVLVGGDPDAAHVVHLAVEEYARALVAVVRSFIAQPEWRGVRDIVLGGGFPGHEAGRLAIRRAARLLKLARSGVRLRVLGHDSDEGGLLGWVQLAPSAALRRQAFLAVDIGGTNIRCGIVEPRLGEDRSGGKARILEHAQWRHGDDAPTREEALQRLGAMLNGLAAHARTRGIDLAAFVGIACPGEVDARGHLLNGAQNLPGDWAAEDFFLADALGAWLAPVRGRAPRVLLHNDAVVQGLSERPRMRNAKRWGVLTIGTGLGNASYSNLG
ncbi:ROK family protein [Luteimonas sp. Sa2BVA3]|uniref:ROK family protein n=1 Tax=Luteimonas colneyensis TaxID=2762230 RepID=A0ABR8ULB7_9GAMM|nr:ROK family protein [Luteimonas colneyensis]MBD7988822.1 ROK family protein [Luteimonas colneyensis]